MSADAAGHCQASSCLSRVIESGFELRPRTIEKVVPVDVLLDQQRNAIICKASNQVRKINDFCQLRNEN